VFEEYARNESVRERQEKSIKVSLKDAKVGSRYSGWLQLRRRKRDGTYRWYKRYFILKDVRVPFTPPMIWRG
jgi:hypothetical protein